MRSIFPLPESRKQSSERKQQGSDLPCYLQINYIIRMVNLTNKPVYFYLLFHLIRGIIPFCGGELYRRGQLDILKFCSYVNQTINSAYYLCTDTYIIKQLFKACTHQRFYQITRVYFINKIDFCPPPQKK